MFHDIRRDALSGKWELRDMDASADIVLFSHTSLLAVESFAHDRAHPPAAPAEPVEHRMLDSMIAQWANLWGVYEAPQYGIDARVIHKPTGKLCVVRGYLAWTPPIVLYSLNEVDGDQLPELTPLSDIADPLEDTVVLPQSSGSGVT